MASLLPFHPKLSFLIICAALLSYMPILTNAKAATSISSLVSEKLFNKIFPHLNDPACPAKGFYTYKSFIDATKRFPLFGTTGSSTIRKREIAAFFSQISHQSASGNANASKPFTLGLCLKQEFDDELTSDYCNYSHDWRWDCNVDLKYLGRGPMMIKWNFNYGPAGQALGYDLQWYPIRLLNSGTVAFETALWVWMTAGRDIYPSAHDVMVGNYKPTKENLAFNWKAGYGLTTNIIGVKTDWASSECGRPDDGRVQNRIGYFKRIAALFKVSTGSNLDCARQNVVVPIDDEFPKAPPPESP